MSISLPNPCKPDILFEILADSHRQRLVHVLREFDQTDRIFLDTLSSQLAERENGGDEAADEISITLHHQHLPKLDEAGLIRYDPTVKMVEFTGIADDQFVSNLATVIEEC